MIRPATLDDIDALVEIEDRCFATDRMSRRSFRYMLTKGHAATLVAEENGKLIAYVMVLFHGGTSLARLYSIAVLFEHARRGLGKVLVEAAEQVAMDNDCAYMRLEIRTDNTSSLSLFRKLGYRQIGTYQNYYEDHADALRFEKTLAAGVQPAVTRVPYYQQTLYFTCGPAALMMAMVALDPKLEINRQLEMRVWRESTTIFMTSGLGGCGPFGLALAAYHRGFDVEIYVNEAEFLLVDSVRSEEKKEVIRLVNEDFIQEAHHHRLPIHYHPLPLAELRKKFNAGGIPLILISSYRFCGEKSPHWVVVTGIDDRFIYVHDPFVDQPEGKAVIDCINMPIPIKDFERMVRYGKSGQRAAVIIYARKKRKARNRK